LARQLKIPSVQIRKQLNAMADMEVVMYQEQKDKPQLTFMTPRYDSNRLPITSKAIEQKKSIYKDKVNAVIH
jgi:ATP-dependent DNA helicase RecQ